MAFVELSDSLIAQVRDSADLVDIISQVTPLKPAGKSYKGLCPFHREKTPSFNVDRARGFFHCFGCGAGGNVFKFLMLAEHFTFPEAVEYVASRSGIQLPRREEKGKSEQKDELLEILEEASTAFHQALQWTPNPADEYLRNREVAEEIWRKYGFGFAPDAWDYLLTRLGRRFSSEKLESAGLVLPKKTGNGHYDRFRSRLMIPIHSEGGNVIGFGGRSLDGSEPKYLNSPETALFNKSSLLYNLHRAKEKMRRVGRAVLVEGYFDCIMLDHAGVPGVVASMGTSLTAGQASALRKHAGRVVIAYDGDEAGRRATLRAAPILLSAGLVVEVLDVGTGYDPDTFLKEAGHDRFTETLAKSRDVFDFALEQWAADPGSMSTADKRQTVEQFQPLLGATTDPVSRNDAAQRIADRLRLEFDSVWTRRQSRKGELTVSPLTPRTSSGGEKRILSAALAGTLPPELTARLSVELFDEPSNRAIFLAVEEALRSGGPIDFAGTESRLKTEDDISRLAELSLTTQEGVDEEPPKFEEIVRHLEKRHLEGSVRRAQSRIQDALASGDVKIEGELLELKAELLKRLHRLK